MTDHNDLILSLSELVRKAEQWKEKALNALTSRSPAPQLKNLLEHLLAEIQDLPPQRSLVNQIEKLLGQINPWYEKALSMLKVDLSGNFIMDSSKQVLLSDIQSLFKEAQSLPIMFHIADFSSFCDAMDRWLSRGKRVMVRPNSGKSFEVMLEEIGPSVDNCIQFVHDRDHYCVCRMPDTIDGLTMVIF